VIRLLSTTYECSILRRLPSRKPSNRAVFFPSFLNRRACRTTPSLLLPGAGQGRTSLRDRCIYASRFFSNCDCSSMSFFFLSLPMRKFHSISPFFPFPKEGETIASFLDTQPSILFFPFSGARPKPPRTSFSPSRMNRPSGPPCI